MFWGTRPIRLFADLPAPSRCGLAGLSSSCSTKLHKRRRLENELKSWRSPPSRPILRLGFVQQRGKGERGAHHAQEDQEA